MEMESVTSFESQKGDKKLGILCDWLVFKIDNSSR